MNAKLWLESWIVGLVVAGLVGCGGSASPTATAPASNATSATSAPTVPAVPLLKRLPGQWSGQMVVDEEGVQGMPEDRVAGLRQMKMGIAFDAQGKMVLSGVNGGQPYESQGSWELISEAGEELTLKSVESDGQQKDIVLMFEGNDIFYMPLKTEVANLGAMKFERMR